MRIAFITFEYPPFIQGGAGVYAYNLAREIARLGHEVHVITPRVSDGETEPEKEGVLVHRLGFLNKPFLAAFSFWSSLRKDFASLERQAGGFDIVHGNGLSDFSLGRKMVSSPRVITIHHLTKTTLKTLGADLPARLRNLRGETGISSFIEPICIRRADRIIAVSQFTRRDLMSAYGLPGPMIEVIYHGARPEDYALPEEARSRFRAALGIEARPMALFVGRLSPRKGVDTLLRALPRVVKETDVRLVLAGAGDQREYLRLAETLGISDKTVFMGQVPEDTLRLLYASCDLFVLPSRLEGLGIVILEAMAAGKPVVATSAGGIPELIEPGQNGILVAPGEEAALASAMLRVLGDRSLARAIGENNLKKLREHFSWEAAARKADRLYGDLIKR